MDVLPLTATFVAILLQLFAIPISWKKCILAKEVTWIGWCFNFSLGTASLDTQKRDKLLRLIQALDSQKHIHKRDIERFLGLAMWLTQLFQGMRPMLQYFYADLFSAPATLYSIDPGSWPQLSQHLDDQLRFISSPQGTAIPIGGILVSVRHQSVAKKEDLATFFENGFQLCPPCDPCSQNQPGQAYLLQMPVLNLTICRWGSSFTMNINVSGFPRNFWYRIFAILAFRWDLMPRRTLLAMKHWPRWPCYSFFPSCFPTKGWKSSSPQSAITHQQKVG